VSWWGVRAAVLAIVCVASTSHAFVGDRAGTATVRVADSVELGGGWRGLRDRTTGVVARMWGSYVAVSGAQRDPAIAERAARAFVAAHLGELAPGARIDDFVLAANQLGGGLRTVAFAQTWRGLRVVGGQVHVVFAHDRLFAAGSDALPNVSARGPASRGAVVLPVAGGYRLATVTREAHDDVYTAADGSVLARTSRVRHATGTLAFDVPERHPAGARHAVAAARVDLVADGVATTTADDGTFAWTGTAPAAVAPSVLGSLIQIANAAGPLATASLVAQPDAVTVWSAASSEVDDAQLSAFVFGSIAKAHARVIAPGLAYLDQPLAISVNEAGSCNALSSGDDLHFFRASAQCENTGRLADVVMHEFGHSFHAHVLIPGAGAFEPALTEGVADFFAADTTGDPGVGRGFFHDDRPVRELDPIGREATYPRDVSGDPHITGLILGGALWDLRTALGAAATAPIFRGVLERASNITTAYMAALVADDDDGNLGNGTPHGCAIEAAFGKHGLAGAGYATTTLAPPTVDGLAIAVAVTTPPATPCPRPQVTQMAIEWQLGDGAPATVAMSAEGATWRGAIPSQPDGTVVRYRVVAALDDGSQVVFPDNPADPLYQLFVGTAREIWCERFDDRAPRWTVLGDPIWDIAAPAGAFDAPGAFSGGVALGTVIDADGRYPDDADTAIRTPFVDGTAYDSVHLQFRRWLTVEDATYDRATLAINGTPVWQNAASPAGTLDHVDREWRFVDIELPPGRYSMTWQLASDGSDALGGWTLDDVCMVGLGKHAVCGDRVVDDGEECDGSGDCTLDCTVIDTGCCSTSRDPGDALVLAGAVLLVLRRRRRRRESLL